MMTQGHEPLNVARFVTAVAKTNPFQLDRVTGTEGAEIDVREVHSEKFFRLCQQVESTRAGGSSLGVLLLAAPGIGKSHLLARLDRWAREDGRCTIVILHNLAARPEDMSRAVLSATIHLLAGTPESSFAQTDLYALLNYAIVQLHAGHGAPSPEKRLEILRKAGARFDPQGDIVRVLTGFLKNTIDADHGSSGATERARLAVEWLAGQHIDAEKARELGLAPDGDETVALKEGREEHVLSVLAGLSAVAKRPFVLCLDQVDNLGADSVHALARFLQIIIDHVPNLVVVTSGVKAAMINLQTSVISPSAWDRIAHTRIELSMILPAEATKIVRARVDQFVQPFRMLDEVEPQCRRDPLFPLSSPWLEKQLAHPELRTREVLVWCRERWAEEQYRIHVDGGDAWLRTWGTVSKESTQSGGQRPTQKPPTILLNAAIDNTVAMKIEECLAQRRIRKASLPPDEARMLGLVTTLLDHCHHPDYTLRDYEVCRTKPVGPYQLWVTEHSGKRDISNGITFLATTSKITATNALKRIVNDSKPPTHRLLVTEERRPLDTGPRGQEYHEELQKLPPGRFRHIELRFEDYALLDALTATLGAAKVGDLEVEWPTGKLRPVTEAEATEAMHRNKWFLKSPLLAELLTEEVATHVVPPKTVNVDDQQAQEFIVAELSHRIFVTVRELSEVYLERKKLAKTHSDSVWRQLKEVANKLSEKGLVHVTPSEDDLFLQSMGEK